MHLFFPSPISARFFSLHSWQCTARGLCTPWLTSSLVEWDFHFILRKVITSVLWLSIMVSRQMLQRLLHKARCGCGRGSNCVQRLTFFTPSAESSFLHAMSPAIIPRWSKRWSNSVQGPRWTTDSPTLLSTPRSRPAASALRYSLWARFDIIDFVISYPLRISAIFVRFDMMSLLVNGKEQGRWEEKWTSTTGQVSYRSCWYSSIRRNEVLVLYILTSAQYKAREFEWFSLEMSMI